MTDFSVIWTPLAEAFRSIDSTITFLLIFGFLFLFSMQIISWLTGPRPSLGGALAGGVLFGALNTWAMYFYLPLGPALIKASIIGIYGNPGYFWVISLLFILLVFGFNALESWKKNKPIMEMIQTNNRVGSVKSRLIAGIFSLLLVLLVIVGPVYL